MTKTQTGIASTEHMERTVLGAMMLETDALLEGVERMRLEDFALESHRRIFQAIRAMASASSDVNSSTLEQQLREDGALQGVGGAGYLVDLTDGIPRRFTITPYAVKLREQAKRRSLVSALETGLEMAVAGDSFAELAAFVDRRLNDLQAEQDESSASIAASLPALVSSFQPVSAATAISTGLTELDRLTFGGLKPGQLWILGAHPGRGKSSLARQIVHDAASSGTPCLVFSIEMTKVQWMGLDAAYRAGVDAWKVQTPNLIGRSERQALIEAAGELAQLPLLIDDAGSVHISHLLARARAAVMRRRASSCWSSTTLAE